MVKVIDSGLGITAVELPHLFDRFYQGNGDRQAKGSGLGLYLLAAQQALERGMERGMERGKSELIVRNIRRLIGEISPEIQT